MSSSKARVLIVGGAMQYVGAPYLAAIAALRNGADSVLVMAPEKVAWAINTLSPDPISTKLKGTYLTLSHKKEIEKKLETADVLVIGNGATTQKGSAALMRVLMKWPGLKVIDADALKVLQDSTVSNAILTPNEREWALLEQNVNMKKILKQNVVVKKGDRKTIILSGSKAFVMAHLHPNLSKAGMGDVLAGLCAGNLAKGLALLPAAKHAAAQGNRIAWALSRKTVGFDLIASDILAGLKRK